MTMMTETLIRQLRADAGYCRGAGQNRLADDLDLAVAEIQRLTGIARETAPAAHYPRRRRRTLWGLLR